MSPGPGPSRPSGLRRTREFTWCRQDQEHATTEEGALSDPVSVETTTTEPAPERDLTALRQEVQQQYAAIDLLRRELAKLRQPAAPGASGVRAERGGVADRGRHELQAWIERLRFREAEHVAQHGEPSRHWQLLRSAKHALRASRPPRRSLGSLLSGGDAGGTLGLSNDLAASHAPGSDDDARAVELALEQSRAIAMLLRGEVARLRSHGPVAASRQDESAKRLVRRGAVIPTDSMITALVGRVRPIGVSDTLTVDDASPRNRASVTIATRFHDAADLPLLERCLTSLQAQRDVDMTALVVLQGFDAANQQAVEEVASRIWLSEPGPRVVNVPNPAGTDLRSALLNRALDIHYTETTNDFFYVLDHDDLVFSHTLASLAGPVVGSPAAVSFGKVLVARYLGLGSHDFLYRMEDHFRAAQRDITELVVDNFYPIHGYIYHTRAMPQGRLRFNESMDRLEDFEALLRVVTNFPVYTAAANTLVGLYCWKGPRAIHGPVEGTTGEEAARWDRNRLELAKAYVDVTSEASSDA